MPSDDVPAPLPDVAVFRALRESPLHAFGPADWLRYYPAMLPWLRHDDAAIRASALERLCMAVFRAERSYGSDPETLATSIWRARWLLNAVEAAHERHADILQQVVAALRWHGDDEPFPDILVPWLEGLKANLPPGVRADRIEGAIVRIGSHDEDELRALTDDASNYVRSCAAHRLGCLLMFDVGPIDPEVLLWVTEAELVRPGIAGPFWSGMSVTGYGDLGFDPVDWMLTIVEQRNGQEPTDLAFNGIDFHVHELASGHPGHVERLIAAGRVDLATQAATEEGVPVAGMDVVLLRLAADPEIGIADAARLHLAVYYNTLAPGSDPETLRHIQRWRPDTDAFVCRLGRGDHWRVAILYPRDGGTAFDDQRARALLDEAMPDAVRGAIVRHEIAFGEQGDGPVVSGDTEYRAYASGVRVRLQGRPDARLWHRIEIVGHGAREAWRPFDWASREV